MACPTFFILQLLLLFYLAIVTVATNNNNDLILDGSPTWNKAQWYAQVDGVMGGQSSGSLSFVEDDTIMSFTGNINLDGGGFSSVRRRFNDISGGIIDLEMYSGIVITLETTSSYNDERNSNSIAAPLGLHLQFDDSVFHILDMHRHLQYPNHKLMVKKLAYIFHYQVLIEERE